MPENERRRHDREAVDRLRALCRPLLPEPGGVREQLAPLTDVKAVLFDVYGTLLVSGSGDIGTSRHAADALSAALAGAGCEGDLDAAGARGVTLLERLIREAHERAHARPYPEVEIRTVWRRILRLLYREALLRRPAEAATVRSVAIEYECRVNPVWPMPGLTAVLRTVHERRLAMGIVSNAQFYTPLLLRMFLESSLRAAGFAPRLCAWSYRVLEAKPSLTLFRVPLEHLERHRGIGAPEILYVGNDMLNDVWPARQLGMKTALFAGDARSYRPRHGDPRVRGIEPDVVLTGLEQLLDVVG